MTRQNARSPRVTFLEKILKPDKDQGNCHPTRNKYTRGHQYSHMERELGLFLNNPGKKKTASNLYSIFNAFTVKAFQSKIHENIRRHYF